jgi:hypothetical protein
MKFNKITLALAAACVTMASISAQATEVEVLHYWTSGGEAKSAATLKQMMKDEGYEWKDFAVAGGGGENAMTALKARVISGNAPTAAQIKGPSIQEWAQEGVLASIDAAVAESGIGCDEVPRSLRGCTGQRPPRQLDVGQQGCPGQGWRDNRADHLGCLLRGSGQDQEIRRYRDCTRRPTMAGRDRV